MRALRSEAGEDGKARGRAKRSGRVSAGENDATAANAVEIGRERRGGGRLRLAKKANVGNVGIVGDHQ